MLSTEAIVWCIQNCSAYVYGDEAKAELRAIVDHINKLESVVQMVADPENSHKRDGSVYIPDVVQDVARVALRTSENVTA
jgi:hypothetical protein